MTTELPENPESRGESYLAKIAGQDVTLPEEPLSREESYLASIAGQDVIVPEKPLSRKEQYLAYIAENGGGGGGGGGDGDWGTVTYLDDNDEEHTVKIQNAYEYSTLGQIDQSNLNPATVSDIKIPKNKITKIVVGKDADYAPYGFMYNATNLNSLTGTENWEHIEAYCLQGCKLEHPIDLSNVTTVEIGFLTGSNQYNQPVSLPKVVTIGNAFLNGCSSFNSQVTLSDSLTSVGTNFLNNCPSFNHPITLPDSLKTIGAGFMDNCVSFNSAISLGGVEAIESSFMSGCTAFAQSLIIPGSTGRIESGFMYNCNNFIGPLVCNAPTTSAALIGSNQTLATQDNAAPMYATGVTLSGSYASIWKNRFSDRSSSPYRKLVIQS